MAQPRVRMYTLSTCHHCKAAKKFLTGCGVAYKRLDRRGVRGLREKHLLLHSSQQESALANNTIGYPGRPCLC